MLLTFIPLGINVGCASDSNTTQAIKGCVTFANILNIASSATTIKAID